MNYCIKEHQNIEKLDWKAYNHLLELNIRFAKLYHTKPRLPETYGNIVVIGSYRNNVCIYGNLYGYKDNDIISSYELIKNANCVIDTMGCVIKNRWGCQEDSL